MSEVLACADGYNLLPEPLNMAWPEVRDRGFSERTHLGAAENDTRKEAWCREALRGAVGEPRSLSPTRAGRLRSLLTNRSYVVKLVRANRMLGWLTARFAPRAWILLMRHPCAVVASWLQWLDQEGKSWRDLDWGVRVEGDDLTRGGITPVLREHDRSLLASLSTVEETIAASWCVDSKMALEAANASPEVRVVYYEDLLLNGRDKVEQMYGELGLQGADGAKERLSVPAVLASEDLQVDERSQLRKWRDKLDRSQRSRVLDVVRAFGIGIYGDELTPRHGERRKPGCREPG